MDDKINWPIRWTLSKFGKTLPAMKDSKWMESTIATEDNGKMVATDITHDVKDEIVKFAPAIYIQGFSRVAEVFSHQNAWLFRALKHIKEERLCIQYIWVFLEQMGVFSSLWTRAIFPITFVWLLILRLLFYPSIVLFNENRMVYGFESLVLPETLFLVSASIFLGFLTFAYGFASFVRDNPNPRRWLSPKARSNFVLMFSGPIVALWILTPELMIIILVVIIFAIEFMKVSKKDPGYHKMDYSPVFVWLERPTSTSPWKFEKAAWDSCHYKVGKYDEKPTQENMFDPYNRIRLGFETLWHDFSKYPRSSLRALQGYSLLAIILGTLLGIMAIYYNTLILSIGRENTLFAGLSIVFAFSTSLALCAANLQVFYDDATEGFDGKGWWTHIRNINAGYPVSWEKMTRIRFDDHYLSESKISYFWNYPEKKGQLDIKKKLQNPFEDIKDWNTWRDDKQKEWRRREGLNLRPTT